MKTETLILALGAYALITSVSAATITRTRSSSGSECAFSSGAGWSDSSTKPCAGNAYLVDNGYEIRTDAANAFGGDSLQFGTVGGTAGIWYKEHAGTHTVSNLILANGHFKTWMTFDWNDAIIKGNAEVLSPESAPFRLYGTATWGAASYHVHWDVAFRGAEGTGLEFGPHSGSLASKSVMYVRGDNSAYLGRFRVFGANTSFSFSSAASLGGALAAQKLDALVVADNTTVISAGTDVTLAASANRGIFVEAGGARLSVPKDNALTVAWPFSGSGTITKTGEGTLTLAGALNPAGAAEATEDVVAAEGALILGAGFSSGADNSITVKSNCSFTVAAGAELTVHNLTLDGAALTIAYDETLKTNGTVVLADATLLAKAITVVPPAVRGVKMPFLKVPTSVATITAANFTTDFDTLAAKKLPTVAFSVETVGDMQIAYATTRPLVTVTETSNNTAYWTDRYASDYYRWSDSKAPHKDADYSVGSSNKELYLNMFYVQANEATFRGSSLSLGGGTKIAYWQFANANANMKKISADVRTYDSARVTWPDDAAVSGRIYVGNSERGSDTKAFQFRGSGNGKTFTINSALSGPGTVFTWDQCDRATNTYVFAGANPFKGSFWFYQGDSSRRTIVKFAQPASFGTDAASAVRFTGYGTLYPQGSQTVAFQSRKFVFDGTGPRIRVDAGETFALNAPTSFGGSSSSVKEGGGTWAIGGAVTAGAGVRLEVAEGYLRADNARAFTNVAVTVGAGAGLAAKYRAGATDEAATYGMIVADAAKFAVAGDTLLFKVETAGADMGGAKVPLLTVPSAAATALDAKAFVVESDVSGRAVKLIRESVTLDGVECVRYSCAFVKGLMVIVK